MSTRPEKTEWPAIMTGMHQAANAIAGLSIEGRKTVLCGMLMQEVCMLPPGKRQAELADLVADLPSILSSTEQGMRMALTENAKDGL